MKDKRTIQELLEEYGLDEATGTLQDKVKEVKREAQKVELAFNTFSKSVNPRNAETLHQRADDFQKLASKLYDNIDSLKDASMKPTLKLVGDSVQKSTILWGALDDYIRRTDKYNDYNIQSLVARVKKNLKIMMANVDKVKQQLSK